jgi:hypothetical protein
VVELSGKLTPVKTSGMAALTPEDTRRIDYELIDGKKRPVAPVRKSALQPKRLGQTPGLQFDLSGLVNESPVMVEINPALKRSRISYAALSAWVFSLLRVRDGVMQYWQFIWSPENDTCIARQVVAPDFSCGPVLGAVSVALPLWIILSISAGGTCIFTSLLGRLCANHDVS